MLDLSNLNPRQREAVTAPLGPVLVLAGAGSGKTRVLATRVAYVIEQRLAAADSTVALTFTNKAAREMSTRVQALTAASAIQPTAGTFHSVFARILRREISPLGYSGSFSILDSEDQAKALRGVLDDLSVDRRFGAPFFKSQISAAKNLLQLPGELQLPLEPDLLGLVRQVYVRYQDVLSTSNALDFDDLLMLPAKLFSARPDVLARYRARFRYILVDEYQDTNHAQYTLLTQLAGEERNLFVVGDDAQSIYGFRGSSIRNILSFEEDFPDCTVVRLEQNYRSTKRILAAAAEVIRLNPEQKPKELWTENVEGLPVEVRELPDEQSEAEFVARTIVRHATDSEGEAEYDSSESDAGAGSYSILDRLLALQKKRGRVVMPLPQLPARHAPLSDFAVLFRTHAQSRAMEEAFVRSGIPYRVVGGVRFYERKEVKDVLAYVRLALNHRDALALARVMNEPSRGVGEKSLGKIREAMSGMAGAPIQDIRSRVGGLGLTARAQKGADEFFFLIEHFQELPEAEELPALLRLVVNRVGFKNMLRDGTDMGETRWENVQELVSVAAKFSGVPWREGAGQLLEEVALITEQDEDGSEDKVTLMTLHAAKGLEFKTVFLTGMEEGVLPHSRATFEPRELSEEVRLAYVGLTRARERLYLTFTTVRQTFGSVRHSKPSRFLAALPKSAATFHVTAPLGSADSGDLTYEPVND